MNWSIEVGTSKDTVLTFGRSAVIKVIKMGIRHSTQEGRKLKEGKQGRQNHLLIPVIKLGIRHPRKRL